MVEYIDREAAKEELCDRCVNVVSCTRSDNDCPIKRGLNAIPAADVVEVVRYLDCKHRIVNEHYGEKGYMKLKAMCEMDTGDPFASGRYAEEDDWFCADGERKDGGQEPPEEETPTGPYDLLYEEGGANTT